MTETAGAHETAEAHERPRKRMTETSVCIIGAGVIGLASAVELARRGAPKVTVLDAEYPASGSSGLSVGIIETQYVEPLDIELRARALQKFALLERDHGLRVIHNGYLRLAHSGEDASGFARSVDVQREVGVADATLLDADGVARLVPDMVTDDVVAGLFGPRDGYLDGHLYCSLLAEIATAAGVEILTRHRVTDATSSHGKHRLITSQGEISCDVVVNAAGAWADRVAALLGVNMPLAPQRHQAIVVHLPRALGYVMPSVMDYTPHSGEEGLYFRHEQADQLIAGLHTEEALDVVEDPDRYARSADADFVETVADKLSSRLPSLRDAGLAHGWAGLYPVSADGLPQIGPAVGHDSIILAGGAGGSGIQLSPVIGELVADWVLHGEPRTISDGARLAPGRASLRADESMP